MTNYGVENWGRFQRTGVEPKDIKAMKMETVVDAFEDTKKDFEHLVEQLAEGIKNERWTSILGDDVSGRLATLIVGGLASRYAREHGKNPPKIIFVAGGSVPYEITPADKSGREIAEEQQQKLEEYIHCQSENLGERVLITTEHVIGGRTLRRLANALHREGKNFDIAALWASEKAADYEESSGHGGNSEMFKNTQWHIGKENAGASGPFGSQVRGWLYDLGIPLNEAAGVKKVGAEPVVKRSETADQDLVVLARKKVNELVDELYLKYFGEK